MTPEQLARELAAGKLRPAYLAAGAEPLLRDDALAAVRRAALSGADETFNLERLEGERATPAQLLDSVKALPVMAAHRLVVLREPEARRGAAGAALQAAVADAVEFAREQKASVLLVLAQKADKRAKWVKAFRAPAATVDCDVPRGGAAAAFIRAEAERRKIKIDATACAALAEAVGPQLLLLRNELEKAALLAGPGETVRAAHIKDGAWDAADAPLWDLTDAIGFGRGAEALALLQKQLAQGAPGPVLLGALAAHFRRLMRAQEGALAGAPFVVNKARQQARRFSPQRLRDCLKHIHQADEILKGQGNLPFDLALQRLVLNLVSG